MRTTEKPRRRPAPFTAPERVLSTIAWCGGFDSYTGAPGNRTFAPFAPELPRTVAVYARERALAGRYSRTALSVGLAAGTVSVAEWKLDLNGCSSAEGTLDGDCPAEDLDTIFQADDARASARIGTAYAVVADADAKGRCDRLHLDVNDRGVRVLDRVR